MSHEKPMESKSPSADEPTKKSSNTELSDEELKSVSGGAIDTYMMFSDPPPPPPEPKRQ